VQSTWSRRGQTPVIHSATNWKKYSAIGVITCNRQGKKPGLFLRLTAGSVTKEIILKTIKDLRRHTRGRVVLVWDGLPAHRAKIVQEYAASQKSWLKVERLPAYAPELNPVEYLWSAGKKKALANVCPDGIAEMSRPHFFGHSFCNFFL
jgi:transposase